ncbi:extracellular solute-binding protein family 1 [Gloeothece citriformis PCC 7424]|uniref:Extracellular solute-binding protein family 1 n=1 Tax=Gloeothece citriformis (strain PCC 7424) TaxID=65393 RepID=B7KJC4_GLOC7|nr:ABC transporter substrate-binding protein [Gloeothece citriformis]ACK72208.1 extracellular solute-binding protein family 1 [Gloeothece citriformis PCC 7424]
MTMFPRKTLIILLIFLLTACSLDSLNQILNQQGELLIWYSFQGKIAEIIKDSFGEFQQLNPEIQILSEYLPQNQLKSQFIKQAKDGLGATIIIDFSQQMLDLVKADVILPLDEKSIDLSGYLDQTLTQIRYQNKIYGLPLGSQTQVLCYNQAIIKQSKQTDDTSLIQPPTRLEELIEQAKKGYSVGMVSTFEDTFWGMGIFDAQWFDDRGLIQPLKLKNWAKWLEWLKKAQNIPNFTLVQQRELLHSAFAQGKLTYYICDSTEIGDLKNQLKDNLLIAPLPSQGDSPATPLLYTRIIMFNHSCNQDEIGLGLQLAEFMTNPEQQIKGIVQSQAFIPITRTVEIDAQILPIETILLQQSKTAIAIPINSLEQIRSIFEEGDILYQKALLGNITSKQAALRLTEFAQGQMQSLWGDLKNAN